MNLKKEAVNDGFDCVILHDVDMLLENGQNIYQCQDQPVQLCPFIDKVRDRRGSVTCIKSANGALITVESWISLIIKIIMVLNSVVWQC